jgi:hypothetical protein
MIRGRDLLCCVYVLDAMDVRQFQHMNDNLPNLEASTIRGTYTS